MNLQNTNICFVHPIFSFWFLVTFGNEVKKNTKILCNLCLRFARQDGQNTKNQKTKIWDERNNCLGVFIVIELFSVYLGHLSFRWAPQRKFTQSDLMKMLKLEKATLPKLG